MNITHISGSNEYLLPDVKFFSYCNGNGAVLVGAVPALLITVGGPPLAVMSHKVKVLSGRFQITSNVPSPLKSPVA